MFTGIVQAIGKVSAIRRQPAGARLVVRRMGWRPGPGAIEFGSSICVSGVCLTVAEFDDDTLQFDVTAETMSRSTLTQLAPGGEVNLEPALTAQTSVGGHFVQGHVDGVGTVSHASQGGDDWRIGIKPPPELTEYIVPKGSVAIDGVSLTVATIDAKGFDVALIPTTLRMTTLRSAEPGRRVNLETDIVSKTVVHWLRMQTADGRHGGKADPVTMETLRDAGIVR